MTSINSPALNVQWAGRSNHNVIVLFATLQLPTGRDWKIGHEATGVLLI